MVDGSEGDHCNWAAGIAMYLGLGQVWGFADRDPHLRVSFMLVIMGCLGTGRRAGGVSQLENPAQLFSLFVLDGIGCFGCILFVFITFDLEQRCTSKNPFTGFANP